MHYGSYAFSKDRRSPTILTKNPNHRIGQRMNFSAVRITIKIFILPVAIRLKLKTRMNLWFRLMWRKLTDCTTAMIRMKFKS